MHYHNQKRGNGLARIDVEAMTGTFVQVASLDGDGDYTVVELNYDEAIELAHKLTTAAELVGQPLASVAKLYEMFTEEGSPDGAA